MSSLTFLEAPSFHYFFQSRIVRSCPKNSHFNLVSYQPENKTLSDVNRDKISFLHSHLFNIFKSPISKLLEVKQGIEVAICSDIYFPSGKIMHVPMLDGKGNIEESFNAVEKIANYLGSDVFIFNSGNSFHCFSDILLLEKEWLEYSEFLLSLKKGVDKKWIVHRVKDGYMCLRLTNNCDKVQVPSFTRVSVYKK